MTKSQKLQLEQSTRRQRINELLGKEDMSAEERAELGTLTGRMQEIEVEYRAALVAEDSDLDKARAEAGNNGIDAETRERVELRSKANLSNYLLAAARGRMVGGPEAELCAAAGVQGIPLELWDVPVPAEQRSAEERAITPAPGTVGINLDPIRPAVFANSIAARLGVDMPRVVSGTYASATITTSQTAAAKPKSPDAAAAAVATAGALTVTTATPKRVSARLELTLEDIAAVGQSNFEAILRQNMSLALSDELDNQAINGDGTGANLTGFLARLTNPAATTAVADFDAFAAAHAGGVDGLWAGTIKDVGIVVGAATYRLSARTFQSATNYKGELSAAAYATENTGGWWTNKRMPAAATFLTVDNVQQAILYRKGRTMMGGSGAMRTAVCPTWGELVIDDVYSLSASGVRAFTMHVLLGDVILVQPDAYAQVAFQVA